MARAARIASGASSCLARSSDQRGLGTDRLTAATGRRAGSRSNERSTTSSSRTSMAAFCEGGANRPSGNSPVSIS